MVLACDGMAFFFWLDASLVFITMELLADNGLSLNVDRHLGLHEFTGGDHLCS